MTVLKLFVDNGICPKLIQRGRNIVLIEVPELSLRFLSSNNYLKGNEYELANQFGLDYELNFFPNKFLCLENFNYEGAIPPAEYYSSFESSDYDSLRDFLKKRKGNL